MLRSVEWRLANAEEIAWELGLGLHEMVESAMITADRASLVVYP